MAISRQRLYDERLAAYEKSVDQWLKYRPNSGIHRYVIGEHQIVDAMLLDTLTEKYRAGGWKMHWKKLRPASFWDRVGYAMWGSLTGRDGVPAYEIVVDMNQS